MAEFSKVIITAKGQALLAKMIAGAGNVEFTKVCTSNTAYTEDQLEALTTLVDVRQTSLISKVTRTNNVAIKVETAFTNTDLTAGYYMRTLGLYALDPDDGEILYAVTVETSGNCYVPPYNGITETGAYITIITIVGNAESVSLKVDSAAFATIGDIQELEEKISDLQAFVGYADSDIYGVEVDFVNKRFTRLAGAVNRTPGAGFDSIECFGGRRRCNLKNDGTVTAYYGEAGFTTTGKAADGSPVQVMVEQPKFYYRVVPLLVEKNAQGSAIRKARYYVSCTKKAGFKLHPAFVADGKENEKIYLAAFEGSLWDASANAYILDNAQVADFAADKLSSIAGTKPAGGDTQNLTRANVRLLARKRGAGWEQAYAATAAASQLLMLIEYASFNMQTAIGRGNTDQASSAANIQYTGATVSLGNASGAVTNANGIQLISYRGEENFWGNIWTWVDGMNEENPDPFESGQAGTLHVADHGFADNSKASPYKNTGIHPIQGSGYVSAFGYSEEFDWLFIAVEYSGNSSLPVGDYAWNNNSGWRVAVLGGCCADGSGAGAFYWALHSAASHRHWNVGGRLVYVPSKKEAAA